MYNQACRKRPHKNLTSCLLDFKKKKKTDWTIRSSELRKVRLKLFCCLLDGTHLYCVHWLLSPALPRLTVATASSAVVSSLVLETAGESDKLSLRIFLQAMTTDEQKYMNISARWDFTHTSRHPILSHHGSNTDVLSPIRRMPGEKLSSVLGVFFIFHPHHSGNLYKNKTF